MCDAHMHAVLGWMAVRVIRPIVNSTASERSDRLTNRTTEAELWEALVEEEVWEGAIAAAVQEDEDMETNIPNFVRKNKTPSPADLAEAASRARAAAERDWDTNTRLANATGANPPPLYISGNFLAQPEAWMANVDRRLRDIDGSAPGALSTRKVSAKSMDESYGMPASPAHWQTVQFFDGGKIQGGGHIQDRPASMGRALMWTHDTDGVDLQTHEGTIHAGSDATSRVPGLGPGPAVIFRGGGSPLPLSIGAHEVSIGVAEGAGGINAAADMNTRLGACISGDNASICGALADDRIQTTRGVARQAMISTTVRIERLKRLRTQTLAGGGEARDKLQESFQFWSNKLTTLSRQGTPQNWVRLNETTAMVVVKVKSHQQLDVPDRLKPTIAMAKGNAAADGDANDNLEKAKVARLRPRDPDQPVVTTPFFITFEGKAVDEDAPAFVRRLAQADGAHGPETGASRRQRSPRAILPRRHQGRTAHPGAGPSGRYLDAGSHPEGAHQPDQTSCSREGETRLDQAQSTDEGGIG